MPTSPNAIAIKKSVFNAANLSGLGAVFLSYSVGSFLGTFIFVLAVIVGSYNKYKAVINQDKTIPQQGFLKILNDPSLTAQILMVAALINFFKTSYSGLIAPAEELLYFAALASAWFFGFLGDNSLRQNDKTNFSFNILVKKIPLWIKTFIYVTRNPVFYFTISNIFFSIAIMVSSNKVQTETSTSILEILNIITITMAIATISYGVWKGIQTIQKKITAEQTNDGIINFMSVLINFTIGTMSCMQGLYWVVLAMVIYAVSNIVHLYETRHALHKEHS